MHSQANTTLCIISPFSIFLITFHFSQRHHTPPPILAFTSPDVQTCSVLASSLLFHPFLFTSSPAYVILSCHMVNSGLPVYLRLVKLWPLISYPHATAEPSVPMKLTSQTPAQRLNGCQILSLFIFSSVPSRVFRVSICGAGAPLFSPAQFQKAKAAC